MIDQHLLKLQKEIVAEISKLQLELKKKVQEALLDYYVPVLQQNGIKFISWEQGHLFNDGDETYFRLNRPSISFAKYNPKRSYDYEYYDYYIDLGESYQDYVEYYDNAKYPMMSADAYAKLTYYHNSMSIGDLEGLFEPEPVRIVIKQDGSYLEIPLDRD
jgi:hypothetical protein